MTATPEERIDRLARQARADRETVATTIGAIPDDAQAMSYLREGVGPAIWVYVEGRTGGRRYPFEPEAFARLEGAMNDWLACYARCYGVKLEASVSIRVAAEALLETRNVRDTAIVLTKVPAARAKRAQRAPSIE